MKKINLPLLEPSCSTGFQSVDLKSEPNSKIQWSVKSYILRGGLQDGVQVVEVNNGKLSFAVLPTRGMGIWKGQYGDITLGWNSPVKDPVNPAYMNLTDRGGIGWLKGFNEWIVRCGINSMGAPGHDTVLDYSGNELEVSLNLHGQIANIPARAVSIEVTDEAITVKGEVDETMMFGYALRLNTEIRTELATGRMTIQDTVTNIAGNPAEHQLLYHINFGETLLEKGACLVAPYKQVTPRDSRAAEGIDNFGVYPAPKQGYVEQAYFYELVGKRGSQETITMLRNAAGNQASVVRFTLKDFPCFTQWKNPASKADGYVTGLEPATSYPNARSYERKKGRVITLKGGESRTTTLAFDILDTKKAIQKVEAEIKKLQKTVKPKVNTNPISRFSDV